MANLSLPAGSLKDYPRRPRGPGPHPLAPTTEVCHVLLEPIRPRAAQGGPRGRQLAVPEARAKISGVSICFSFPIVSMYPGPKLFISLLDAQVALVLRLCVFLTGVCFV